MSCWSQYRRDVGKWLTSTRQLPATPSIINLIRTAYHFSAYRFSALSLFQVLCHGIETLLRMQGSYFRNDEISPQ